MDGHGNLRLVKGFASLLPGCFTAAAAVTIVTGSREVWSNDWIGLGLERLALIRISEFALASLWSALALAAAGLLVYWLTHFVIQDTGSAGNLFSILLAVPAAIAIVVWAGYWPSRDSLLDSGRIVANGGIGLACIVLAGIIFLAVRTLARWCGDGSCFGRKSYRMTGTLSAVLMAAAVVPGLAVRIAGADGPNVILISLDTLRADHLGSYGYGRETSPHIDRLAEKGVLFENVTAHSNWTLPSHMSIMTSQIPSAHGVLTRDLRLAKHKVMVAEILRNAGYETFAVTGGFFVDERFGFGQGFDEYLGDDNGPAPAAADAKHGQGRRLAAQVPRALEMISAADGPFFLFLHAWDTHAPYMPHEEVINEFSPGYGGEIQMVSHEYMQDLKHGRKVASEDDITRIRALYDNEIRHADQAVGEFLDGLERLGLTDDTIIVLTSDHGDELLEHGFVNHGGTLYQPEIFVPLILSYPKGVPAGRRVKSLARSIDIAPTILELAGVPISSEIAAQFQGRSLAGACDHNVKGVAAISESPGAGLLSVRLGALKFIRTENETTRKTGLYDLEHDPGETMDISGEQEVRVMQMKELLESELRRLREQASPGHGVRSGERFRRKLESLGYLQ